MQRAFCGWKVLLHSSGDGDRAFFFVFRQLARHGRSFQFSVQFKQQYIETCCTRLSSCKIVMLSGHIKSTETNTMPIGKTELSQINLENSAKPV